MPTRLPVLLQSRKSAAAGVVKATARNAQAARSIGRRNAPDQTHPTLFPTARIIRLAISRRFHLAVNEDGAEVIDVRECGTRPEQAAQALEEARGVVVGKKRGRSEAESGGLRGGLAVREGTRLVVRRAFSTVGAVGIGGERGDAVRAGEPNRQRQRVFLVRPAAALAAD